MTHSTAPPPPARRHLRATSAFTLVELVVVIAILAVIAALLTPGYRKALADNARTPAELHAQAVRMHLGTVLAANPQLNATTLGSLSCTAAGALTPAGTLTTTPGTTSWDDAPQGMTCTATPLSARAYQVTVTYDSGTSTVTVP